MLKMFTTRTFYSPWVIFYLCLLEGLLLPSQASATGQGPIGVWPASERYALVADTSLPGLVLIDLDTGVATERLLMEKLRPVGVASCPDCNFVLITGGTLGRFWRLQLQATTAELLRKKGTLDLANARLEPLQITTAEGQIGDGRMALVSTDGKSAYVASSKNHALIRLDLGESSDAVSIIKDDHVEPYGVNWDNRGGLLVSMHKREVWRTTLDGEVLAVYDTKSAGCPGTGKYRPNLRAAIDDPLNESSVLILATNPKSYDAVVWRLQVDAAGKQSCTNVAGKIGGHPGWVDASGEAIEFSRPHHFVLRPETWPPQLIVSDIDNRALRILDLETYSSSSLMYNRDHTLGPLPLAEKVSKASCNELAWPLVAGRTASSFCVQPVRNDVPLLTLEQAKAHCSAQQARLCEPAELRSAAIAANSKTWSAAECASCWQRRAGEHCDSDLVDFKTEEILHSHKDFVQSWHSGQALGVAAVNGANQSTVCLPVEKNRLAAAFCCADQK